MREHPDRFGPCEIVAAGRHDAWLLDWRSSAWVRIAGTPLEVVDIVDSGCILLDHGSARTGPADDSVWVVTPEGLARLSLRDARQQDFVRLDGAQGVVASGSAVWVTLDRPPFLVRVHPDTGAVTPCAVDSAVRILASVSGGVCVAGESGNVLTFIDPESEPSWTARLPGLPLSPAAAGERLLVEFHRSCRVGGGVLSGIASVDTATGEIIDLWQRDAHGTILAQLGGYLWVKLWGKQVTERDGDDTVVWSKSVLEALDPNSGAVVARLDPDAGISHWAWSGDRLWLLAGGMERRLAVTVVDATSGDVVNRVDVSDVWLSSLPERKRRPPPPHPWPETGESGPPPSDPARFEEEVREHLVALLITEPELARFISRDLAVETVRTKGSHPGTTYQVLFRHPRYGDCLFGWESKELWGDDHIAGAPHDGSDPVIFAQSVEMEFLEDATSAGWGPPDECDPDVEGVTWLVDPYDGRGFPTFTFADRVEHTLRYSAPLDRPFSRDEVQQLLADTRVSSADDLLRLVRDEPDDRLAEFGLWLIWGGHFGEVVERLAGELPLSPDPHVRARTARRVRRLVYDHVSHEIVAALHAETDPDVQVELLRCVQRITTPEGRAIAMELAGGETADDAVRGAAAEALGEITVGQREVRELLAQLSLRSGTADAARRALASLDERRDSTDREED